jgi:hypothetical protein
VLAATQDNSLVLGVGYGCSQYNLPKKKEQESTTSANSSYLVNFEKRKKALISQCLN